MERRLFITAAAASAGLAAAGCSAAGEARTSAPAPAMDAAALDAAPLDATLPETALESGPVDRVVHSSLAELVAAADAVVLGTLGSLRSFVVVGGGQTSPKYAGAAPDVRTDAVLDVSQTLLARPGAVSAHRYRVWFFGGQADGQRYTMASDPLPRAGERYLMFLTASPGVPHSSPSDPALPQMQSTGLGDGRWLVRADGTLQPTKGVQPWLQEALAGRTVADAAAAIRAVA